jgi:hypothetical protein
VKSVELVARAAAFVTLMRPVVARTGTLTRILVAETTVIVPAFMRLNPTARAVVRFVPLMVTSVPTRPLEGVNELIDGRRDTTAKFVALVAVPLGPVTLIFPLVAVAGTVAII